VTNPDQVQAAIDAASGLGPLRGLVNAAGLAHACRTVDREGNPFPLDQFEFIVRVNLIGSFNCLRLAAATIARTDPVDEDGQRGAIVNLSSIAAFEGQTGQAAYAASKGGVVGMTLPIARDLSRELIRVNTILPGIFNTPLLQGAPENVKQALGAQVPHPARLGNPEEYASLAREMITNAYFNGEDVRLDGAIRMAPR
jgi:NAD(P)-dependent dehydrogenase (short-subunit alcohol dehydrogenase family)